MPRVADWTSRMLMTTALTALPALAQAQDRTALVIANSGYADDIALPDVRDAALEVSEALFGLGFAVTRLENPSADELTAALKTTASSDGPAVIYYAGHAFGAEGKTYLQPVAASGVVAEDLVPLSVALDPALTDAVTPRFVFLDSCHGDASAGIAGAGALAGEMELGQNVYLAASAAPGMPCAPGDASSLTDLMLERLTVPGLGSDQLLPDDEETAIWTASTLPEPFVFRTATSDMRLTAEDYAILDTLSPAARDQMIALWKASGMAVDIAGADQVAPATGATAVVRNETVVLTAPVRPVNAARATPVVRSGAIGIVTDGVSLVSAPVTAAPAIFEVTPTQDGLPQPSILIGFVVDEAVPTFDVAPEEIAAAVSGAELSFDNLEARQSMREQDAELFAGLVAGGAFDPPTAELATALQIELQRMNCYTSRIDGDWGPGSRRSVARYYEQIGEAAPSQEADVEIFRQIVMRDDVTCPEIVAAPAPRRATTTTTTRTQPRQQAAAPRRAAPAAPRAAPAPAPAPAAPARTMSRTTGTGVFR